MILVDWQLTVWAQSQQGITPFDSACINPSSIDLKLGNQFIHLSNDGEVTQTDSIIINPGDAYLATTMEYIRMPDYASGVVYLKSSLARQGLDHALAGFVDVGFCGQITMELHSHRAIELQAGQRVIQLVLYRLDAKPDNLYNGRYQNQTGPTKAREIPSE